jgi:hypothetical protein
MKKLRVILILGLCLETAISAFAAGSPRIRKLKPPTQSPVGVRPQATSPTLLMEPYDWRFESMTLPPRFAPNVRLSGVEEIRFAPGVFDAKSPNYFTYIMALTVNGTEKVDDIVIKDFLEKYYRGLLPGVGKPKGISVLPSQITAKIAPIKLEGENKNDNKEKSRYQGRVSLIDTFTDGRDTKVNVEADVLQKPFSDKTYIILLLSPQALDSGVWSNLRAIRDKIDIKGL